MPALSNFLVENFTTFKVPIKVANEFHESHGVLPEAIFPDYRVLTANKVTQNKTFYSEASLKGKASKGTGITSFTRPYPIPVIKDHDTSDSSNIYGRVTRPAQFVITPEASYLRAIATITHPEAIHAIMTGRWNSVSLGSRTESVKCSISNCQQELTEEMCEHEKGQTYKVEGKSELCYWMVGEVTVKELSHVIQPSDTEAGVLNPNFEESAKENPVTRVLAVSKNGLYDLFSGHCLTEQFQSERAHYPLSRGNFHFRGF